MAATATIFAAGTRYGEQRVCPEEDGSMTKAPRTTQTRRASAAASHAAWITRLVEEACNDGNLAILDEIAAPAGGVGGADAPAPLPIRERLAAFRAAVPDARWTILQQVTEGDTVVTRLSVQGTFSGPLVGLAPPGRPATLTGVAIGRFSGGRLVELWLQADLLAFLQQLDVLPPLRLAQAVTLAQVLQVGAQVAHEPASLSPASLPQGAAEAHLDHPASQSRPVGGISSTAAAAVRKG
jgi:predicted ester cyclase